MTFDNIRGLYDVEGSILPLKRRLKGQLKLDLHPKSFQCTEAGDCLSLKEWQKSRGKDLGSYFLSCVYNIIIPKRYCPGLSNRNP